MKFALPFIVLICVYTQPLAQTFPVPEYLKTWALDDITQTQKAALLFDDLSQHKDSAKFDQLVYELEKKIDPIKDPRIAIRFSMYKTLWMLEHWPQYKHSGASIQHAALELIRTAYPLKDNQLNAELYTLFGELCLRQQDIERSVLYNLRALDMQEQIGAQYFPKIGWTYFSVARSLYHTRDYLQSVKYGLKAKQQIKQIPTVNCFDQVFLSDIIGSAYNKSGNADSARWYFQEIKQLISNQDPSKPQTPAKWNALWMGITDGYLGRIEVERKNYSTAAPLLQHAVDASLVFGDTANAASFLNNLAGISQQQKEYPKALQQFRQAWQWSNQTGDQQAIAAAAQGLSQLFRDLQQPDSGYFYFGKFHVVNDSLTALINRSQLNAARAKLDYEKLQETLAKAEQDMHSERSMRKLLVVAIILLLAGGGIAWYRIRRKQKRKVSLQQQKIRQVQQKEAEARNKLQQFKTHIEEKNEAIEALQQQLTQTTQISLLHPTVLLTEDDWVNFKNEFIKTYPGFFPALREAVKDLSPAQERLATLIKLNFDNAQAAACLGISKDSVSRSKRRLRQSIGLPADAGLEDFILSLR